MEPTALVESERGPHGVDGHWDGPHGGERLLQGVLVAYRQAYVAGAVGGAVGGVVAALPILKGGDQTDSHSVHVMDLAWGVDEALLHLPLADLTNFCPLVGEMQIIVESRNEAKISWIRTLPSCGDDLIWSQTLDLRHVPSDNHESVSVVNHDTCFYSKQ